MLHEDSDRLIAFHHRSQPSSESLGFGDAPVVVNAVKALGRKVNPHELEITDVGRSLFDRGYVHGTAGNISVRLPEGYLITPTDACLGYLDPGRLAKVSLDGTQLSGERASKTLRLHQKIYGADETAHCVIHTHSRNLVALSLSRIWNADDVLPPITPYYVMKVGHVPLIPYHRPGDAAVGELVVQKIQTMRAKGLSIHAVLTDRLGPNVWHTSPATAMATLEELEETAYLWRTCEPSPVPLTPAQIDQLRITFGASW